MTRMRNKTIQISCLIIITVLLIGYGSIMSPSTSHAGINRNKNLDERQNTVTLGLTKGWNLVSVPYMQSNNSIDYVFGSIHGSYDVIESYNATDSVKHWKTYFPDKPKEFSDLQTVNNRNGLWIHMTSNTTLMFNGSTPVSTTISLVQGWNLIGYPSIANRTVSDLFSGVPPGTNYKVQQFDNSQPYMLRDMTSTGEFLHLGFGYWVYISTNYDLTVTWQ